MARQPLYSEWLVSGRPPGAIRPRFSSASYFHARSGQVLLTLWDTHVSIFFKRRRSMSATNEQQLKNWWAEGDTPVHADSQVAYLVDAHSTFLTMCRHLLMARKYIYIAAWGMTPLMALVRGTDQRAGPDGSPEQEALLAELREEGLQEPEIDFWCTHDR